MRLFTRTLRNPEPRQMMDHIDYMQETLEQRTAQMEKEKQETNKKIAELEARLSALSASEV